MLGPRCQHCGKKSPPDEKLVMVVQRKRDGATGRGTPMSADTVTPAQREQILRQIPPNEEMEIAADRARGTAQYDHSKLIAGQTLVN